MKNLYKVFRIIALVAVIGFSFAACGGGGGGDGDDNKGVTFKNVEDFELWLSKQPDNTAATPYTVKLNISNLDNGIRVALRRNKSKYVYLDLSGSTITEIPDDAFLDYTYGACTTLTGITIPNSVTSIGSGAFMSCTGLTSVTIPNSVTGIGRSAFSGCTSLTSVTIPNSVTYFSENAFLGCTSLASVTCGRIGINAFSGCTSLTSVTIVSGVNIIPDSAFSGCTSLTSITIPNSVTKIDDGAFSSCKSLTSITIPSSVTDIWDQAFYSCTSLTSVTFETGSNISGDAHFGRNVFPEGSSGNGGNSLKTLYLASSPKAGTYTRTANGSTWTKQSGGGGDGGGEKTPEEKPAAERWKTWISSNRPAQVTNTVDSDGVCTITIGSSSAVNQWDGASQYDYTAKAGSKYRYEFEAWTTSPATRNLDIQYYYGGSSATQLIVKLDITSTRKTYTINGNVIPVSGVSQVEFRDATTVGTFKIKMISITEY